MVAPNGLKAGQKVISGPGSEPEIGNATPIRRNTSRYSCNITLNFILGRVGLWHVVQGAYAQLTSREGKFAILKLPSGESRMVLTSCSATVGTVGNTEHNLEKSGKAGRSRWLGRRPRVRGVAMNPVDHPMGGGEGRSSGGHPRSRKGVLAKGYKTRSPRESFQ